MSKSQNVAVGLAKFALLFTAAVYVLSLPYFYFLMARPFGLADGLMPYEAVLCSFLSGSLFLWSFKAVYELLRALKK